MKGQEVAEVLRFLFGLRIALDLLSCCVSGTVSVLGRCTSRWPERSCSQVWATESRWLDSLWGVFFREASDWPLEEPAASFPEAAFFVIDTSMCRKLRHTGKWQSSLLRCKIKETLQERACKAEGFARTL